MQDMECIKNKRIILNIYRCGKYKLVNVFDVVDCIVDFHKVNKKPLCKKRLFSLLYIYNLLAHIGIQRPRLDDAFFVKHTKEGKAVVEPAETARKCSRFSEDDDLTKMIKPCCSSIFLASRKMTTSTTSNIVFFLEKTLPISIERLSEYVETSFPFKNPRKKDGLINFKENKVCQSLKTKCKNFSATNSFKKVLALYFDLEK